MTARLLAFRRDIAGVTVFLAALLGTFWDAETTAHTGASGPVKQRMEIMKSMGAAAKTIQAMVTGKRSYDGTQVARLATEIAGHVPTLPKLFPKGSHAHPSEAKPTIWADWKGFNASLRRLHREARRLAEIAPTAGRAEVARQFRRVGQSCSGCHRDFRKRKK
jgi:cytochrome c556